MRRISNRQRGVALVLAIFTLMLISVVGTALILMAGTQSAIKSNYKSAMHAFYDAKAGLEEGRGRLWNGNPNALSNCVFPTPGAPMPLNRVCYIVNPSQGETVNPLDLSADNPYADNEYQQEFPQIPLSSADVPPPFLSNSAIGGIAGPLYKWVRITPTTEYSSNVAVQGNPSLDQTSPLFFDGTQRLLGQTPGAGQVLSITSLSFTPYGSRRIVQYSVWSALGQLTLNFPSALVMPGPNPTYEGPGTNSFYINGYDRQGSNPGSCGVAPQPAVNAIGVTGDTSDVTMPNGRRNRYIGNGGTTPNVVDITSLLPSSEQTVTGLDGLVTTITNAATDVVTPPSGTANTLPNFGSATNPVVEVVQGNLTITPGSTTTGYGILLVTGTLRLGGGFGWRGIVLVIGQGHVNGDAQRSNEFDGAFFVATTRDASNHLLSNLGAPFVDWADATGGNGIYYDSCWINTATLAATYQVLSFREIAQTTP